MNKLPNAFDHTRLLRKPGHAIAAVAAVAHAAIAAVAALAATPDEQEFEPPVL